MTTTKQPAEGVLWYALSAGDAAERIGVDPDQGLDVGEVERRLAEYGPNELPTEPPPSLWAVARGQLVNPMNIMLLIVGVASFAIGAGRHRRRGAGAGDVQRGHGLQARS